VGRSKTQSRGLGCNAGFGGNSRRAVESLPLEWLLRWGRSNDDLSSRLLFRCYTRRNRTSSVKYKSLAPTKMPLPFLFPGMYRLARRKNASPARIWAVVSA